MSSSVSSRGELPVLDQPEVLSVAAAVTHGQDAVVQLCAAAVWLVVQS